MTTFNQMTGTSDYERQSWRDSHNGGRAAGDITGNVNRSLDAQRAASGGYTNSGSSTQWSASEASERGGGTAYVAGGTRAAVSVPTKGAGASGVIAGATAGPGSSGVLAGPTVGVGGTGVFGGPRRSGIELPVGKPSPLTPIYMAGRRMAMDRGWSDAQDGENRWGENEFLSPSWFHAWGVAGADTWANLDDQNGGPLKTRKIQEDLYHAPGVAGDVFTRLGEGFLETRKAMRDPFGPDQPTPGFSSGGF